MLNKRSGIFPGPQDDPSFKLILQMQYICLHDLIYHLQTGKYSIGDDPEPLKPQADPINPDDHILNVS